MDINITLLGQMITFAIFVAFTMKYVWPPITKAMAERQAKIANGLAAAEKGEKALEEAQKEINAQMQEARREAAQIIEQANKRSLQMIDEAKSQARVEGEKLLTQAQAQISQEINQAKQALKEQVAHLAVFGAEKILRQELDSKKQQAVLGNLIKDFVGDHDK